MIEQSDKLARRQLQRRIRGLRDVPVLSPEDGLHASIAPPVLFQNLPHVRR